MTRKSLKIKLVEKSPLDLFTDHGKDSGGLRHLQRFQKTMMKPLNDGYSDDEHTVKRRSSISHDSLCCAVCKPTTCVFRRHT